MSKSQRILLAGAALGACAAALWIEPVQSQQLQRKDFPQSPQQQSPQQQFPQQQDLQQQWQDQQSQMRARLGGAIQQLQAACGQELRNFCGTVTPGEGRMLLCIQAHEDKLSKGCEMALFQASRNIEHAMRRVERIADACWHDIQALCAGAGGSVAQCMLNNREQLSPPCQAMVAATQSGGQQVQKQQPSMTGIPVFSSDGMRLGQVTGIKRRPDGSVEAIEADVGAPLGMGSTAVLISPGEMQWKGDRIELQMAADQVRSILQGQRR